MVDLSPPVHMSPILDGDVTVIIPTIRPRIENGMLDKALASVNAQTWKPFEVIVEEDTDHIGSAATRNIALQRVRTGWVAFLDDDDEMLPEHLDSLYLHAMDTDADLVYSVPIVPQSPTYVRQQGFWWQPFDEERERIQSYIQSTVLVRTDILRKGGGFWCPEGSIYDDWGMVLGVLDAGGKVSHLEKETFIWNHWGFGGPGRPGNTSGQGSRW